MAYSGANKPFFSIQKTYSGEIGTKLYLKCIPSDKTSLSRHDSVQYRCVVFSDKKTFFSSTSQSINFLS